MNKKVNLDQGTDLPEKFLLTQIVQDLIMMAKKQKNLFLGAGIKKT